MLINFINEHLKLNLPVCVDKSIVEEIFKQYNLLDYLDYFNKNNLGKNNPYHNEYHSYSVVLNCYQGAIVEGLSTFSIKSLLLAALFHDFNHSGGEFADDNENINQALGGLFKFIKSLNNEKLTAKELILIGDIIKITKYPYEEAPSIIEQKIIRDSDLMQAYEQNQTILLAQYTGLYEELIKTKTELSFEQYIIGSKSFLSNIKWETDWAKYKEKSLNWQNHKEILFELFKLLV